MQTMLKSLTALGLGCALALGNVGCIKKMILDGTIEGTRKGSAAIDTMSDYEVANAAAFAGLAQFEGFHYLAPDNQNALFLLTKGWTGATYAFIEDRMEQAEDAEDIMSPLYLYEQARARAGYDRAIHYGVEMLENIAPGFEEAKKNDETMKAWLANFDDAERDAQNLFWVGYAWIAKVNTAKDEPAVVSELFIGVAMMERSVELDETYLYGSGRTILGAYHARSAMAELDQAKIEFDKALAISAGRTLLPKVQLAAKYYCTKGDKENYVKTLNEVLDAGDVFPQQRFSNMLAKRRAKRYLSETRMKNCGF